jgi:hypothetical protein
MKDYNPKMISALVTLPKVSVTINHTNNKDRK